MDTSILKRSNEKYEAESKTMRDAIGEITTLLAAVNCFVAERAQGASQSAVASVGAGGAARGEAEVGEEDAR